MYLEVLNHRLGTFVQSGRNAHISTIAHTVQCLYSRIDPQLQLLFIKIKIHNVGGHLLTYQIFEFNI